MALKSGLRTRGHSKCKRKWQNFIDYNTTSCTSAAIGTIDRDRDLVLYGSALGRSPLTALGVRTVLWQDVCPSRVSVRPCVRHMSVLCQNSETYSQTYRIVI